ncbi:MAG: LysR substrate-binding domain-containing protein [Noviherbaspirillum sp.]
MLEDGTARARMLGSDQPSTLHLRVPTTFGEKWLMRRFADFNRRHPDITVQFAPRFAESAGQAPFSAEIRGGRGVWDGMHADYLTGREMALVSSAELAGEMRERNAAEFLNYRLLEHVRLPHMWERWFSSRQVAGYDGRNTQHYEQFSMMISALRESLGIAFVPCCLIEEELQAGTLIQLLDSPLTTEYGYYLVYPKDRCRSTALERFSNWLTEKCAGFDTR